MQNTNKILGPCCFECGQKYGVSPRERAIGVWIDTCSICGKKETSCADAGHDFNIWRMPDDTDNKPTRFTTKLTEDKKNMYVFEFFLIQERANRLADIQLKIDNQVQEFYGQMQQLWADVNILKQKLKEEI
jgi:hypothetical protein